VHDALVPRYSRPGRRPSGVQRTGAARRRSGGPEFTLTVGEILLLVGVVSLFIEIVKATRSSMSSAVDHALSALVFAVYLIEFLLVKAAGTGVFLVLTVTSFLDLIAGFTVTIGAARRDLTIAR
jgi:hypothetical protein